MKLLITAGGTAEKIDGVRVITNLSTGKTGAFLAEFFRERGADVTLLQAGRDFDTVESLSAALKAHLSGAAFDGVIHAAAVSDYTVAEIMVNGQVFAPDTAIKLPTSEEMTLKLTRTPKLINQLRAWSKNPAICVIGFKLTRNARAEEAAQKAHALLLASGADFVVQNDSAAISSSQHPFCIFAADGERESGKNKKEMAECLFKIMGRTP